MGKRGSHCWRIISSLTWSWSFVPTLILAGPGRGWTGDGREGRQYPWSWARSKDLLHLSEASWDKHLMKMQRMVGKGHCHGNPQMCALQICWFLPLWLREFSEVRGQISGVTLGYEWVSTSHLAAHSLDTVPRGRSSTRIPHSISKQCCILESFLVPLSLVFKAYLKPTCS